MRDTLNALLYSEMPMPITDITRAKVAKAFAKMRQGNDSTISFRSCGLADETFYKALREDPDLKKEYAEAMATGADTLVQKVRPTMQGQLFLLARVYGNRFGKHKEEELELQLSNETSKILKDDASAPQAKIKAIMADLHNEIIPLTLAERMIKLIVTAYPELNKTEISGDITIHDDHPIER